MEFERLPDGDVRVTFTDEELVEGATWFARAFDVLGDTWARETTERRLGLGRVLKMAGLRFSASFEKPVPRVELGEDWLDQMLTAAEPLRLDRRSSAAARRAEGPRVSGLMGE